MLEVEELEVGKMRKLSSSSVQEGQAREAEDEDKAGP